MKTRGIILIHVKPGRKSSTLSHLFAQGRVSAEAFKRDREFRKGVRCKLRKGGNETMNVIPIDGYKAEDYEIVFLFIDDRPGPLSVTLPFFSQVNMMHTVVKIQMMGYRVTFKKVLREKIEEEQQVAV